MNSVFQDRYVDTHIDIFRRTFFWLTFMICSSQKKQKSDWVCKIKKILKLLRGDQIISPFQVKTINFAKRPHTKAVK